MDQRLPALTAVQLRRRGVEKSALLDRILSTCWCVSYIEGGAAGCQAATRALSPHPYRNTVRASRVPQGVPGPDRWRLLDMRRWSFALCSLVLGGALGVLAAGSLATLKGEPPPAPKAGPPAAVPKEMTSYRDIVKAVL